MDRISPGAMELLLELAERPVAQVSHTMLMRGSAEAGRELVNGGWLVKGENLDSVICEACHDDHAAEVEFDLDRGVRHYCPEAGWTLIVEEQMRLYWVDVPKLLAELLSEVDPGQRRRPKEVVPELVWEWGDVRLGRRRTRNSLWFVRRLADAKTRQQLKDAVGRRPPAMPPRLILTSTPAGDLEPGPRDHLIISLRDVLGDCAAVDGGILTARLGVRPTSEGEPLTVSADGRSVRLYDQTFEFPRGDKQRQVINYLFRRLEAGDRQVATAKIITDLNFAPSTRVRDLFKGSPAWDKLLTESKGVCRFCLRDDGS